MLCLCFYGIPKPKPSTSIFQVPAKIMYKKKKIIIFSPIRHPWPQGSFYRNIFTMGILLHRHLLPECALENRCHSRHQRGEDGAEQSGEGSWNLCGEYSNAGYSNSYQYNLIIALLQNIMYDLFKKKPWFSTALRILSVVQLCMRSVCFEIRLMTHRNRQIS